MTVPMLAAVPFLFAFLVIYGALSDLATFHIPNWVSYVLVLLFVAHSFLTWFATPFLPSLGYRLPAYTFNIMIAVAVLSASVVFWSRGYIGGGDAKYLTATALWMGAGGILSFIILLSGFSLMLALALKLMAKWEFLVYGARLPFFAKTLFSKVAENKLPYGFPIGLAALVMIPQIFRI